MDSLVRATAGLRPVAFLAGTFAAVFGTIYVAHQAGRQWARQHAASHPFALAEPDDGTNRNLSAVWPRSFRAGVRHADLSLATTDAIEKRLTCGPRLVPTAAKVAAASPQATAPPTPLPRGTGAVPLEPMEQPPVVIELVPPGGKGRPGTTPLAPPACDAAPTARGRKIIDKALPNSSAEERDLWHEMLKELPPNDVRELMRVREQIGKLPTTAFPPLAPGIPPGSEAGDSAAPRNRSYTDSERVLEDALIAVGRARQIVANNLANAQTTAFKRSRANFEDLSYQQALMTGAPVPGGQSTPIGLAVGSGTRVNGTQIDSSAGSPIETGRPLDLVILGDGYFQVTDPQSRQAWYTRAGTFGVNSAGQLVLASAEAAYPLEPAVSVPPFATQLTVAADGVISVRTSSNAGVQQIGVLQTATFPNPQGLQPVGQNLFEATDASGKTHVGAPGLDGHGRIRQRALEGSNVDIAHELQELERLESHAKALERALAILRTGTAQR